MDIYEVFRNNIPKMLEEERTSQYLQLLDRERTELEQISGYSIEELKALFLKGYELQPGKPPVTMQQVSYEFAIVKISDHYGYEYQSRQCVEEMAELTKALNKEWRCKKAGKDFSLESIIEEIADVEVCLDYLKYFLCCHNDVEKIKHDKIERQLRRMSGEESDV